MRCAALIVATTLLLSAGCNASRSLPPTPSAAKTQVGEPITSTHWQGDARLVIDLPSGKRSSGRLIVVSEGPLGLRFALLADAGPVLAEVVIAGDGTVQIEQAVAELREQLGPLAKALRAAYMPTPERSLGWNGDVLTKTTDGASRLYAGDPVLCRQVLAAGWTIELCDYRLFGLSHFPYRFTAKAGWGVTVEVQMQSVNPQATPANG